MPSIGVLALQGAFAQHCSVLKRVGANPIEIRTAGQLKSCSGLIIPGGESTTIYTLLKKNGLIDPIKQFAQTHPLLGTCAGLILMAKEIEEEQVPTLGILSIKVRRNAYGTQLDSFEKEIEIEIDGEKEELPAIFIRAPVIEEISSTVEVLATNRNKPILVKEGIHLGATFHPELSESVAIHQFFLSSIK